MDDEARRMSAWCRAALAPARVDLRLRPGPSARAAIGIYSPLRFRAAAAARLNRALLAMGMWRSIDEPLRDVNELARLLSVSADAVATRASSAPGRLIVGFAAEGSLRIVAKVGRLDDDGLRREGAVLQEISRLGCSDFEIPTLRWLGEWCDRYVVAVEASDTLAGTTLADARRVAIALAGAKSGQALTHGDFAPWNLVRTSSGLLLLDWEEARLSREPLVDLTHFVVQSGTLLGMMSPSDAVNCLTAPGGDGWQYLEATGCDPSRAPELVMSALYLDAPGRANAHTQRFREAMMRDIEQAVAPAIRTRSSRTPRTFI
jgi:hypothetical protein